MYRRRGDGERVVLLCCIRHLYSKPTLAIPHKGVSKGEAASYVDRNTELCGKLFVCGGQSGFQKKILSMECCMDPHSQHLPVQKLLRRHGKHIGSQNRAVKQDAQLHLCYAVVR